MCRINIKLNISHRSGGTSDKSAELGLPTVNYIADQLHMSANYMSDVMRKETGRSAQDCIHDHMIEKASYTLLNSDSKISQISHRLGFEYPQCFSRVFKKKTGLTPGEYWIVH